jgi:hypothetical protein
VLAYWLICVVFRREANRSHFETFLTGVALFLLANMALIALFRIRFYFGMVLHSSYRTYALVLWAVGYLALLGLVNLRWQKRAIWAFWGLFLFVNVLSYFTYLPEAIQRRKHMQGLTFNQQYNQIGLGGTHNSPLARWIIELDSTMHVRQWHTLPNPAITPTETQLLNPQQAPVQNVPLRITDQPDYINLESDQPGYEVGINRGTYVVFWPTDRPQHPYVLFAELRKPTGLSPFSRPFGWLASMPKALLPPGKYTLGLFETTPTTTRLSRTEYRVQVGATQ